MRNFETNHIFNPNQTANPHVLFEYAHPDDEVLNLEGLKHTIESGIDTTVVFLTTGSASTLGERKFVRSGGRVNEAALALSSLGLREDNMFFLKHPDGNLSNEEAYHKAVLSIGEIIREREITTVVTTGPDDIHSDHVSAHKIALTATGFFANINRSRARLGLQENFQTPAVMGLTRDHNSGISLDASAQVKQEYLGTFHTSQYDFTGNAPNRNGSEELKPYQHHFTAENYAVYSLGQRTIPKEASNEEYAILTREKELVV